MATRRSRESRSRSGQPKEDEKNNDGRKTTLDAGINTIHAAGGIRSSWMDRGHRKQVGKERSVDGDACGTYMTTDDTLAEVLADGYFDVGRRELWPMLTNQGLVDQGGRMNIQAKDGRAFDTLYDDGGTLKMRGGRFRLTA